MIRTIKRDVVAILLFSRDGKLFQGKRNPAHGGVWSDCWNIPGGGVEEGESKEDAIRRETLEETGVDISGYPLKLVDDVGFGSAEKTLRDTGERVVAEMKFTVYKVVLNQDAADVKLDFDEEFVEGRWSTIEEAKGLVLTPPTIELFQRLGYM
jgi:8-oxo-dGTP pyrophosphatase MutT (NUDIX family)